MPARKTCGLKSKSLKMILSKYQLKVNLLYEIFELFVSFALVTEVPQTQIRGYKNFCRTHMSAKLVRSYLVLSEKVGTVV